MAKDFELSSSKSPRYSNSHAHEEQRRIPKPARTPPAASKSSSSVEIRGSVVFKFNTRGRSEPRFSRQSINPSIHPYVQGHTLQHDSCPQHSLPSMFEVGDCSVGPLSDGW